MATKTKATGRNGMHTAGIFSDVTADGPEIGTLVVIIDRAKNLPNRKTIGKQDPYCAARLGKDAKKTDTDRRGGQTPRWDQELRFAVHDSPEYYQLKISVFNDDNKTDLIGETWINLQEVVVPGGGQNDLWHNLSCKGKYAGEVRLEVTYYDTRPKQEKYCGSREPLKRQGKPPTLVERTLPYPEHSVIGGSLLRGDTSLSETAPERAPLSEGWICCKCFYEVYANIWEYSCPNCRRHQKCENCTPTYPHAPSGLSPEVSTIDSSSVLTPMKSVLGMTFEDLDPANMALIAPSRGGVQMRERAGSQGSVGSNGRMSPPTDYSPRLGGLFSRDIEGFPESIASPNTTSYDRLTIRAVGPQQSKIANDLNQSSLKTSDDSFKSVGQSIPEIDNIARNHPLYRNAKTQGDGLYHCPWEGQNDCRHKPQKLKYNYDILLDSHLKPYRCNLLVCQNLRFSSIACLLRHEREAHARHGHYDRPFLCTYDGCKRGIPGSGFPRRQNLRDHLKGVHNDNDLGSRQSPSLPPIEKNEKRRQKPESAEPSLALNDVEAPVRRRRRDYIIQEEEFSLAQQYQQSEKRLRETIEKLQDPPNSSNLLLLRQASDCVKTMCQMSQRINAVPVLRQDTSSDPLDRELREKNFNSPEPRLSSSVALQNQNTGQGSNRHTSNGKSVFTNGSRDSGYISRTSTTRTLGIQSLPQNGRQDQNSSHWDSQSIASVQSGITDGTMSSINPAARGGAAEEAADLLVQKDLVRDLIVKGYRMMDHDRFERNFRRLLKELAINLRKESQNDVHKGATKLIHNYRAYMTRFIRNKLLKDTEHSHSEVFYGLQRQAAHKVMLERFISNSGEQTETETAAENAGSDIDSGFSEDEKPALPNLQKVKDFIVSSMAFTTFVNGLDDFVNKLGRRNQLDPNLGVNSEPDIAVTEIGQANKALLSNKAQIVYEASNPNQLDAIKNEKEQRRKLEDSLGSKNLNETSNSDRIFKDLDATKISEDSPVTISFQRNDSGDEGVNNDIVTSLCDRAHSQMTWCVETSVPGDVNDIRGFPCTVVQEVSTTVPVIEKPTSWVTKPDLERDSEKMGKLSSEFAVPSKIQDIPTVGFGISHWIRMSIQRSMRPKLPNNHRRVEWICGCGDELYADFENDSEDMHKLAAILQRPNYPSCGSSAKSSHCMDSLNAIQVPGAAHVSKRTGSVSSAESSAGSSSSTLLGSSNSSCSTEPDLSHHSYLEVCINTGEYTKTLSEINLDHIRCDGQLFRRIRSEYVRLRSYRSRFWLLRPSGVHFVRFAVEDPLRVGILQKPLAIPPQCEVDAKNYIYSPCPLQGDPPMPQDTFLHYLSCTASNPKLAWLPRLPKKLDSSILRFTGAVNYGWGIHIHEGPNYFAIGIVNIFMMIVSGLVAFLWKYFKDDFQGAFGFAGWIVAVVNGILVAYIAKWRQE